MTYRNGDYSLIQLLPNLISIMAFIWNLNLLFSQKSLYNLGLKSILNICVPTVRGTRKCIDLENSVKAQKRRRARLLTDMKHAHKRTLTRKHTDGIMVMARRAQLVYLVAAV